MKTTKQIIGDLGEEKASELLSKKGYKIIETNYRFKKAEIDIIAKNDLFLVFIEVKTRKNNNFGNPEEFVSERKIELFQETAEHYMLDNKINLNLRFDIISVIGNEIEHFEDAF